MNGGWIAIWSVNWPLFVHVFCTRPINRCLSFDWLKLFYFCIKLVQYQSKNWKKVTKIDSRHNTHWQPCQSTIEENSRKLFFDCEKGIGQVCSRTLDYLIDEKSNILALRLRAFHPCDFVAANCFHIRICIRCHLPILKYPSRIQAVHYMRWDNNLWANGNQRINRNSSVVWTKW